jgi:hypothetical protein
MRNSTSSKSSSGSLALARLVLVAGDTLVFVFFAIQGRATHGLPLDTSPILTVVVIAAPFAVPWFVAAWLMGVYRGDLARRPIPLLTRTAIAWLVAGPIGLLLRAVLLQRAILIPFAMTAIGINAALLLGWHLIYSLVAMRRTLRHIDGERSAR